MKVAQEQFKAKTDKSETTNPTAVRSPITTHVLDTSKRLPVPSLPVSLYQLVDGRWTFINGVWKSGLKPIYEKDNQTSMSRRSSQVFVNKPTLRKDKLLPSIVCTRLSKSNLETVHSVVKSLGRFKIEKEVTARTSHIVVEKENFRTVKLLNGILRGCWIVSCEWVFSSFEAGEWLSEDKYEITSFSPAVRLNRYDRQVYGPEYNCDLFKECGTFFVSAKCSPPTEDLKQLITLCGGRLVGVSRSADIIIGGKPSLVYKGHNVSEKWVLDCISKFWVLDFDEYELQELKLSLS